MASAVSRVPGAVLQIQGACVGTFTIGKNLALAGNSSARFKMARPDGNDLGDVLTITAGVVSIKNLKITGGNNTAGLGGGITNYGVLTLTGNTTVSGNHSGSAGAGGIFSFGTVTMNGHSLVAGNSLNSVGDAWGAGIYDYAGGHVTLNGSAAITGHSTSGYGGGIYIQSGATFTMNDASSVANNTAAVDGGGIYNQSGSFTGRSRA